MTWIRVVLIILIFRDVTTIPCVSNESKKDLDDSRKSLIDMKSHIEKTIVTLENGFKRQIGVVDKAFNTAVAALQNKLKTAVEVNKNQIGVMKRALNTVGAKILKVDKSLQVLGKDIQKTKWHKYNGHCYYYSQDSDKQDWFTAEKNCRDIRGYLIKIDNKEELKSITANRRNSGLHYWIGLVEIDEGQFRWDFDQTKLTMLSNWHPGFGNKGTRNNCVMLHASRTDFVDYSCGYKTPYICESNFCF